LSSIVTQPGRGRRLLTRVAIGAGVIVVLISLFDGFYTIDQGDIGVQLRNGAVTGTAEPGFHWQVPVIDSVRIISVRTQKDTYEQVQSYSKDIQAADLRISVTYHADPSRVVEIYSEYGSVEGLVDRVISPALYNETKIVFGSFNAATAIAERGRLVAEIEAAIRAKVAGEPLVLESVQVEDIAFSEVFENSVEQRMLAEVEVAKLKQNLEREKVQADIVRTQAEGKADSTRSQAQAEADAIRIKGEAEAAAIKARGDALRDNPNLVQLILAEAWNGQLPTSMIPGSAVPFLNLNQ
jgi:regulator of protease activity HflC (stomatin/prohibitin superfamily)